MPLPDPATMTEGTVTDGTMTARPAPINLPEMLRTHWPLIIGFAAAAIATLVVLGRESWSREAGAHGPIVLATGIWLLFQVRDEITRDARPLAASWIALLLIPAVVVYALGRSLDLLFFEAAALYAIFLIGVARFVGIRSIFANFFPFLYLAFLIPVPGWVIDMLTVNLREWISGAATTILSAIGYPVAREGIVIYIAQYQLLVEDACSGLNSLIGLTAISIFYIYILHRASWRHAVLLLIAVIPIAIVANLIRVIILILMTYYGGDAMAQGFLHNTAGIMLFAIALMLVVATDYALRRFLPSAQTPASNAT
jgi:exosortase